MSLRAIWIRACLHQEVYAVSLFRVPVYCIYVDYILAKQNRSRDQIGRYLRGFAPGSLLDWSIDELVSITGIARNLIYIHEDFVVNEL